MRKAARAIVIEDGKILLMQRNKQGAVYYTLVGGKVNDDETYEQALIREVREETGLEVKTAQLVFYEEHPDPYNEQYIYLCEVEPHEQVAIQTYAEEHSMNKISINIHEPQWVYLAAFPRIAFRTPQLHDAIMQSLKNGFPAQPIKL